MVSQRMIFYLIEKKNRLDMPLLRRPFRLIRREKCRVVDGVVDSLWYDLARSQARSEHEPRLQRWWAGRVRMGGARAGGLSGSCVRA